MNGKGDIDTIDLPEAKLAECQSNEGIKNRRGTMNLDRDRNRRPDRNANRELGGEIVGNAESNYAPDTDSDFEQCFFSRFERLIGECHRQSPVDTYSSVTGHRQGRKSGLCSADPFDSC